MSMSMRIDSGDLVVGSGRSFETVSGKDKLIQDLTLWILERIGTDPATPTYGSTLDGGVISGRQVDSFVGAPGTEENLVAIRAEISRMLSRYQQEQLITLKSEVLQYQGQNTFEANELISEIAEVRVRQIGDVVLCRVLLLTVGGDQVRLTIPVDQVSSG